MTPSPGSPPTPAAATATTTAALGARRRRRRVVGQTSLDDLGTPLIDVTFCVLDLETTGGSPTDDEICEVGAVKVRGGECVGTFHTFVDPGRDIPTFITMLTGLTTQMVRPAPTIGAVLPTLLEFLGDAVFVAHNARFDRSFLDAAMARTDREPLGNVTVDTCTLARRLVRDEVPDCTLDTLASRLRLDHRPTHRALDDALATADLLHVLLERAAGYGAFTLDDLVELPAATRHPQARKLSLTDGLPRGPGVYLFRDATGRVLYVGKATDLRARVRSYFSSDTRRKVGGLLRETASIDHRTTTTPLEAAVVEMRLIHELLPRYNRQGTRWRKAAYVKLTREPFPRLSVVRTVRDDACYLGPLPSSKAARRVVEAIESALPIRRCTANPATAARSAPCAPAQLGVSTCPCAGAVTQEAYREIAMAVEGALGNDPTPVLEPLGERMQGLAAQERFEEAADVRDRANAFVHAHRRVRRFDQLRRAGRLVVVHGEHRMILEHGLLAHCEPLASPSLLGSSAPPLAPATEPAAPEHADELIVVSGWLERHAHQIEVEHCDHALHSPLPALADLGRERTTRRGRDQSPVG